MKAELVPENGDPPIPITKDLTVIGRREFCDVRINDPSLSKRHCVIVKTDGLLVVRDLATTNGTKVKGQRIRWAALLPDDRLALGSYKCRVYLGPDDVPAPSERTKRVAAASFLSVPGSAPAAGPRVVIPAGATPAPEVEGPKSGFPTPSSQNVPVLNTDLGELEILPDEDDEDDPSDSGWRRLIQPQGKPREDGFLIELD